MWASAVILALWLCLPLLTPVHVEGFSASLAALAIHLKTGSIESFDLLQPLNTQYFGLTKLGSVIFLAGLLSVLPIGPDLALNFMMWSGLAALLLASVMLVRRWSGASWRYVLLPLLLFPGILESSFFYNDNVPSAGAAAVALCLLYGRSRWSAAAAGALFGLAVLTRTDTILVCAAAPIIVYERFGFSRMALTHLAIVAAAGGTVLIWTLAMFHASLVDVLRIGVIAVEVWDRPPSGAHGLLILVFFVGAAGLVAAACGAARLARRHQRTALLRLCIVPLLVLLVMPGKLWEIRQLLLLTPFLCALATIGLQAIFEGQETKARRLLRPAIMALTIVGLVGPPAAVTSADGPRVLGGRVWMIPAWRGWQAGTRNDFALLDALIGLAASARRSAIIPDDWNEDRYLHLLLLDRGYHVAGPSALPPACRLVAEHFVRGKSEVVLVRNHQSFVSYSNLLSAERFARLSRPCLGSLAAPAYIVMSSSRAEQLLPGQAGLRFVGSGIGDVRLDPVVASLSYGPLIAFELNAALEARLLKGFRADQPAEPLAPPKGVPRMETGMYATRSRLRFPGA
ncbi:MAG: hypothetical protein H7267_01700 [Sandarakinorhabdus sp.]|nr:hypothetical protein [Sandarakinorhabdus sp.]